MRRRLSSENGSAVIISMMVIAAMLGLGMATFGFVDSQTKLSGYERNDESAFTYSEGVLGLQSYLISTSWPGKSTQARPDCSFDGTTVTATGGTGGVAMCPAAAQLASSFPPSDYAGVKWTVRVRDNGGTERCALTNQLLCSYYYDDAALAGQPSWDANADGQVWIRAQSLYRRDRRTLVERVRLDQQPVNFPEAVITAGHLYLKESPHLKVVTNYSPINLRCAINTSEPPEGPQGQLLGPHLPRKHLADRHAPLERRHHDREGQAADPRRHLDRLQRRLQPRRVEGHAARVRPVRDRGALPVRRQHARPPELPRAPHQHAVARHPPDCSNHPPRSRSWKTTARLPPARTISK